MQCCLKSLIVLGALHLLGSVQTFLCHIVELQFAVAKKMSHGKLNLETSFHGNVKYLMISKIFKLFDYKCCGYF